MSALEKLINDLSEEDLLYLEQNVIGKSAEEVDALLAHHKLLMDQADAVQYALKINLNSVYGVQIMSAFKFADEWQILGASTTLSGRILTKYGMIEAVEQYLNESRESRFEFPLLDNILVASDDDNSFFQNPMTQKLRHAVISDTDSVSGDTTVLTNLYGRITLNELEELAMSKETVGEKTFSYYENLAVTNLVDPNPEEYFVSMDDVEFLYSHETEKEMYEIELEDGKRVVVTEDHSIMVLDKNNRTVEKKPKDLTEDDICLTV